MDGEDILEGGHYCQSGTSTQLHRMHVSCVLILALLQRTSDATPVEPGALQNAQNELQQLQASVERLQCEIAELTAVRTQLQNEITALGQAKTCLRQINAEVCPVSHVRLVSLH